MLLVCLQLFTRDWRWASGRQGGALDLGSSRKARWCRGCPSGEALHVPHASLRNWSAWWGSWRSWRRTPLRSWIWIVVGFLLEGTWSGTGQASFTRTLASSWQAWRVPSCWLSMGRFSSHQPYRKVPHPPCCSRCSQFVCGGWPL